MIEIGFIDDTDLNSIVLNFRDMSPLIRQWKEAREDIFLNQKRNQLNPQNLPLRSLSRQYQQWKDSNYPGRVKRELTGKTYNSHVYSLGRNTLLEEISENAVFLQHILGLPLLPDEWTNPTEKMLIDITNEYIDEVLNG